VNLVDPSGLWTVGIPTPAALSVDLNAGISVSVDVSMLVLDGRGNVGILQSGGFGASTGFGGSLGVAFLWSDAECIGELEGLGGAAGGSTTIPTPVAPLSVGGDYITNRDRTYSGVTLNPGIGFHISPEVVGLPAEGHGRVTYSKLTSQVNIPDTLRSVDDFLTDVSRDAVHRAYGGG
jgi:hypothetical protein